MTRQPLPRDLVALIRSRHDVVARRELLDHGLSARAADHYLAWCTPQLPGVAWTQPRASGPATTPFLVRASAGVLFAGETGGVTGLAGLWLHGLGRQEPTVIRVVLPPRRQTTVRRPGWTFLRGEPGARTLPTAAWPPRFAVDECLLDAAAEVPADRLLGLIADACQQRHTSAASLQRALERRTRQRHRAVLSAALSDLASGTTSMLELNYLRDVERAHGLPASVRQFPVPGTDRVADGGYPQWHTLWEVDGRAFHSGSRAFRDAERDNTFALLGWTVLRFGWHDVIDDPCRVARIVGAALNRAGWLGKVGRCPRCPGSMSAVTER